MIIYGSYCLLNHQLICHGVEGLYRQKQSREADLERVKTTAREIIHDPVTSDKHRVRETLSELQEKWQDLSDRLVQMISYTVSYICTILIVVHFALC